MSSKGQVVIPEEIRNELGLGPGTQFVVVGDRDVVILKALAPPNLDEFDDLIGEARRQAQKAGMSEEDVQNAVDFVKGKR
jgi:AbrB family looped-hinge helix DNA binding protein